MLVEPLVRGSSINSSSSSGSGAGICRIALAVFQLAGSTKAVFSFTAVVWSWIVVSDLEMILLAAGLSEGFCRALYDSGWPQEDMALFVDLKPTPRSPRCPVLLIFGVLTPACVN